jgi:hypothetical protein
MLRVQSDGIGLEEGLATRVDEWNGYDGELEAVYVGGGASTYNRQELGWAGRWVHPSEEVIGVVMGMVGVSSDGFIPVEVLDGWMSVGVLGSWTAVRDPECDPAFEGACTVSARSSGSKAPCFLPRFLAVLVAASEAASFNFWICFSMTPLSK